tara:strand:- start:224 stop:670 length:447 start_codon:yes stop_codon:yes gene_type:complete
MAKVRKAKADDMESVIRLLKTFPEGLGSTGVDWDNAHNAYPELLKGEKGLILVIEEDDAIVGIVTLSFSFVLRFGGEYALIEDFIIHSDYRGKGLARPLLSAAIAEAGRRGCPEVQVNGPSKEGVPVYIKNGFAEVGIQLKTKTNFTV